ncbi:hypothetical protein OC835_003000 [Tilletia horrida]|nr:hypothetical protein OC835_003000 [Tilletia horrida]
MLNTAFSPKSSTSHSSLHSIPSSVGASGRFPNQSSPQVASSSRTRSSGNGSNLMGSILPGGSSSGGASTRFSPRQQQQQYAHHQSPKPDTFVPDAAIPVSLKEKNIKQKALKLPVVSTVVDAIINRFRVHISTLHLHEPNSSGFHVDLFLRLLGTGPLKAKIFFPQGVTLFLRLPSHEEFCVSAANAQYNPGDHRALKPEAPLDPTASQNGTGLSPPSNNGLPTSPSSHSIASHSAQASENGKNGQQTHRSLLSSRSFTKSSRKQKLHTSASASVLQSNTPRASYLNPSAASPSDFQALDPANPGKGNSGDLGEGTLFAIKAHLEPVKMKPIGDVPARIRIEASGAELAGITALVNKVVRTHGEVKLILRAEGIVVKAYGLRVSAKSFEKDIVFDGLSHLTNILHYDRQNQSPSAGLSVGPLMGAGASPGTSSADARSMRSRNGPDGRSASMRSTQRPSTVVQPNGALPAAAPAQSRITKNPSPYSPEVVDLKILAGSPERGIECTAKINLPNPANLTVDLAALEFDLCISSDTLREAFPPSRFGEISCSLIPIGYILLEPTRLQPGDNFIEAYGRLVVPNPPPGTHPNSNLATIVLAGKQFLAGMLENRPMRLAVTAPGTTTISPVLDPMRPLTVPPASRRICQFPWLSDALEGIVIDLVLPPLGERVRLLDGAEFRFEAPPGHSIMAGPPVPRPVARTTLRHGLGVPIQLYSLKVDCIIDFPAGVTLSKTAGTPSGVVAPKSPAVSAFTENGRSPNSSTAPAAGTSAETKYESLRIAIVQSASSTGTIVLPASGEPVHQTLPVQLNPDIKVLIKILRGHAALRNVELGSILTKVLDTYETGIASVASDSDEDEASKPEDPWHDLGGLTARILEGLRVRAMIEVDAAFGDFHIPGIFRFQVRDLPVVISAPTASSLIPHISQPIVTDIMQRMTLHLDNFVVNELSVHGIHAQCDVRLLNFGPMRSEVRFREGLELMLMVDGKWTRCGTALIADMITVDPYAPKGVQSDVFVVPLAGHAGGEVFAKFVQALVQEQTFSVFLAANQFSVKTGGVNFLTPIHKAITLEGMNGLRGLTVDDIEILGEVPSPADAFRNPDQKDALRIRFKINIPNQSSINLALARITLYMMFEGVCVGDLEVDEIQLKGKHVTHADGLGTIYIGADDQHETRKVVVLEKIGKLFSLFVAGKSVDLEVRGRRSWAYAPGMGKPSMLAGGGSSLPGGANGTASAGAVGAAGAGSNGAPRVRQSQRIAWLDSAVRTINLPVSITLPAPLMIVKQIDIGDVTATFTENEPPVLAIRDITAIYELPYSISLQVLGLSLDLQLLYRGVVLGTVKTGESGATDTEQWRFPARANEPAGVGGRIKMGLETFALRPDVDPEALAEAIAIVADEDDATHLQVIGQARVRARTALGPVTAEIQLGDEHIVSIKGLKGLRTRPMQHEKLSIDAANKDHINLRFDLLVYNPSPKVSIHVLDSEVSFAAYFKNHYVGRAIVRNALLLDKGECLAKDVVFHYQPAPEIAKQVASLPSNLMSGRTTELWIQGDRHSTKIPTLLRALQTIRVPFLLKPILNGTLIDSIATRLSMGMLTSQTCLVEFVINNPLGVSIDVLDLSFRAMHRGEPFAKCSTSFRQTADPANGIRGTKLSVPPASAPGQLGQQVSPPVETEMAKRIDKMVGTLVAEKGLLHLDIELEAHVELSSAAGSAFPVVISYSQSGLPLKIRGLPGLG